MLKLLAVIGLWMMASATPAEARAQDAWLKAFCSFTSRRCPDLPVEARDKLAVRLWEAAQMDKRLAATLAALCFQESSMRVRKYFPQAAQNMDYMGAHNVVLFRELQRSGDVTGGLTWRQSEEWARWRAKFQEDPALGTLYAARAFCRLREGLGTDEAIQVWKCGSWGSVASLEYLQTNIMLRNEILSKMGPGKNPGKNGGGKT